MIKRGCKNTRMAHGSCAQSYINFRSLTKSVFVCDSLSPVNAKGYCFGVVHPSVWHSAFTDEPKYMDIMPFMSSNAVNSIEMLLKWLKMSFSWLVTYKGKKVLDTKV